MPLRARMCSAEGSLVLLVSTGRCQTEQHFLVGRRGGPTALGSLVAENACYLCGVRPARIRRKYTRLCVLWLFELESYLNIQFFCFCVHLAVL